MMDVENDENDVENDENERPLFKAKVKRERVPGVRIAIKEVLDGIKRTLIDQHNFMYRRKKIRGDTTYWVCKHKNCPVNGAVSEKLTGQITVRGVHSHLSNACKVEATILQAKLIRRAIENPTVKPRVLYSNLVSTPGVHEDVLMSLSSQYNLSQQVTRERFKAHVTQCGEPKTFLELVENMPENLKVTNKGEKLLSYTGYADEENEARGFMVFASRFGIDLLSRSDTWVSDGTFCVPNQEIFEQVHT